MFYKKWGTSCDENADAPHYVVIAQTKEKISKKLISFRMKIDKRL